MQQLAGCAAGLRVRAAPHPVVQLRLKSPQKLQASRRRTAFCGCAVRECVCACRRVCARGAEPSVTSHGPPHNNPPDPPTPLPQRLVCHTALSAKSCDYNTAGSNLTRAHTTSSGRRRTRRRLQLFLLRPLPQIARLFTSRGPLHNCSAVEIAK